MNALTVALLGVFWAAFLCSVLSCALGLMEFMVGQSSQRYITGKPRLKQSAAELHRRRQALRNLLTPALITYVAAVCASLGASMVGANWLGQASSDSASRGGWLIVAGGITIVVTFVALIAVPPATPWSLVRNREKLLAAIQEHDFPASDGVVRLWRDRLGEFTADAASPASPYHDWEVPVEMIGYAPSPITGSIRDDSGERAMSGPGAKLALKSIRETRRLFAILILAALAFGASLALVGAGLAWPINNVFWYAGSFLVLTLAGAGFLLLAGKQEVVWNARLRTENAIFEEQIESLIHEHERAGAEVEASRDTLDELVRQVAGLARTVEALSESTRTSSSIRSWARSRSKVPRHRRGFKP